MGALKHETAGHHLKTNGKKALSWCSMNFLLANPERFQFLNINPRKLDGDNSDAVLGVDGIDINKLEQIKLLGLRIDDNLNFTEQILASYEPRLARKSV